MELERRGSIVHPEVEKTTGNGRIGLKQEKPFCISKRQVWEAYKRVKANKGASGVDGQTLADFETDLKNNLYKIWNRMSSGSYFAPPILRVEAGARLSYLDIAGLYRKSAMNMNIR